MSRSLTLFHPACMLNWARLLLCAGALVGPVSMLGCTNMYNEGENFTENEEQAKEAPPTSAPVKVGVILCGSGMRDGTEIYEAVLTIVALEKEGAEIIMMAPNINQASVVNHAFPREITGETRNALVESARIARGRIVDIATVNAKDLHALIIPGGIGAVTTLSDIQSKGADGTVDPEVERLVKDMYSMEKPIGSMCLASMILAKVLGENKINITIGKDHQIFGPVINTFGAIHVESDSTNIVTDKKNRIVTTPAVMGGLSNVAMSEGIGKMVHAVVQMTKNSCTNDKKN